MVNKMLTEPIKLDAAAIKVLDDMALSITLLKKEVEKAKRAGLDMKEMEAKLNETVKLREGLLREYR